MCWTPVQSHKCCLVTVSNGHALDRPLPDFYLWVTILYLPVMTDIGTPWAHHLSVKYLFFILIHSSCLSTCLSWHTSLVNRWSSRWSVSTCMVPLSATPLYINTIGFLLFASNGNRSQVQPQGAFPSQHSFPLAGYSFRGGSQWKESWLMGTPSPTVLACVFLSVAPLRVHCSTGSLTLLQRILTQKGPCKLDFFLKCVCC